MLQRDSRSFDDEDVRIRIAQVTKRNESEVRFICDFVTGTFSKRLLSQVFKYYTILDESQTSADAFIAAIRAAF